jgi:hypothetical protein
MARVRSFGRSTQDVRPHPTQVDCEHQVIDDGTQRLLHLSTFGSDERASERKSSQSLQLDERAARELVEILAEAFPGLRRS